MAPWTAFVALDHIRVVRLRQLADTIHMCFSCSQHQGLRESCLRSEHSIKRFCMTLCSNVTPQVIVHGTVVCSSATLKTPRSVLPSCCICSSLPEFATLYLVTLHLTCFDNWPYRQCCTRLQSKGGSYNHDGVPKITWTWEPRDAHIYGVCIFSWHRTF